MTWLWLAKNWRAVLGVLGALALLLSLGWMTHSRNEWRSTAKDSTAALALSAERYKTAAEEALADQQAHVITVKNEQEKKTKEVIDAYETKLAVTTSAAQRLREQAAAYSRSTSGDGLSATREDTCRAFAGTSCEAIPPLLTAAQENTDQLIALQTHVKAQEAIVY